MRWSEAAASTYICSVMSRQELLSRVQKTAEAIPEEQLPRFVSIMDQIKEMLDEAEFDARVKRIIDENRGLLERLAK